MKRAIDERIELTNFEDKLKYVKQQMQLAKTNKLEQYYSGGKGPKDDPMQIGNVQPEGASEPAPAPSTLERILGEISQGINALKGCEP